ncbi:hypothetical protein VNO78_24226 [Psophocarpus tetragonolobus]|uniref:Uncharacterized protein n=1 Tax=Psophocarpus tetragonolobus TaxID=3891 RepID=A0AAN9XEH3_PSOTE
MTITQSFSCEPEIKSLLISSNLLPKIWTFVISSRDDEGFDLYTGNGLSWKVDVQSSVTIVAFEVKPSFYLDQRMVSSAHLNDNNFHRFQFLLSKKFPVFSLNRSLVALLYENLKMLDDLQISLSSPRLIITGLGIGGSIASLFTLSLLDETNLRNKRPLCCITFGSPLVGDKRLQEAISRSSTFNSCFLHVVSHKDPVPRRLNPHTKAYMPFGTFFFCSHINFTCFENPESVLEILVSLINDQNQGFQPIDYGSILQNIFRAVICKDFSQRRQLWAADLQQEQYQKIDIKSLVTNLEKLENEFLYEKRIFDPLKKLSDIKVNMSKVEWYKRHSECQGIGYYDSFKMGISTTDLDVVHCLVNIRNYWKDMVKEADMMPYREAVTFRARWLYGGTNYMRMVEPLDIAEYYRKGGKDYMANGRSTHYKVLEEWLKEDKRNKPSFTSKKNVKLILSYDSCFWAHVEEALLLCQQLENVQSSKEVVEEAIRKLREFEEYVYGSLKKYEVSPEIFLSESSYMKWWKQYKEISCKPELASFMSNPNHYDQYTKGYYDFP